ncbi:ATP synthase mitochondrial F1 complex assembly factor 2-like isoform X2 [Oryctolagus cuniculus]
MHPSEVTMHPFQLFWVQGRGKLAEPSPTEPTPKPAQVRVAETMPATAERKRFYQNVSISQGEGGFEINLDHRKLKTPQAKLFTVPSEALAIAVATEWESQQDTIKSYTMHLTTLCNTSLDNPTQRSKDQLIRAAIKFLDTDTICYRVEEPETLVELQKNEWDPVIEWAENRDRVRGDPAQVHGADLGPDRPAPDGGAGRAAVAPGGGVPGLKPKAWPRRCGVAGKATACSAGIPYGHWFKSRLLHFWSSSLLWPGKAVEDGPR